MIVAATFSLGATASLSLSVVAAALFTLGWRLALRKSFKAHRWVQTAAASLNAALVLAWMGWTFGLYVAPELPDRLGETPYAVTTAHAVVGSIGLILGLYVVLSASEIAPQSLRFSNFKLFMRASYGLYMLATMMGLIVYIVVYAG